MAILINGIFLDKVPRSEATERYILIVAIKISFSKLNARTIRGSGWLIISLRSTDHTNYQTVFVFAFSGLRVV